MSLEPIDMVVDAHVHYWQAPSSDLPHAETLANIGPPVSVEQLLAAMIDAGVTKAVQVTPSAMGYDNRYSLEGAARHPDQIRVFGRFDPTLPNLPARLRDFMSPPGMAGIRLTLWRPYNEWFRDGTLDEFWAECEALRIPLAIYAPRQASQIAAVARRHSGLRLLVDHFCLIHPSRRDPFEDWSSVLDLANVPNVWAKVSYIPEVTRERYPFPQAQKRFREAYERFGADRMMFGSNFPPVTEVGTYREAVDFVREACDFIPIADRAKILGTTAERFLSPGG